MLSTGDLSNPSDAFQPSDTTPKPDLNETEKAIIHTCRMRQPLNPLQYAQIKQLRGWLDAQGATADQVRGFRGWWEKTDWRGKQGQRAKTTNIQEEWDVYLESLPQQKTLSQVPQKSWTEYTPEEKAQLKARFGS